MIKYIYVFLGGGFLCAIGQILVDRTKLTPARILTSYVVAGVILSSVGLYKYFADFALAGASVPLTGFGHTLAEGVRQAVDEQGLWGIFTGGLKSSSGGICAAVFFSLITALCVKPGAK